ncbi:MAG: hypothetical protein NC416_17175 [Eubacterium sp.]|nr:hypothetical protein [Eubacterium sp.]
MAQEIVDSLSNDLQEKFKCYGLSLERMQGKAVDANVLKGADLSEKVKNKGEEF